MVRFLEKSSIFATSVKKDRQHRGEQISFDPPENLQIRSKWVISLKAVPPIGFIRLCYMQNSIYTYRCEPTFILTFTGIAEPSG